MIGGKGWRQEDEPAGADDFQPWGERVAVGFAPEPHVQVAPSSRIGKGWIEGVVLALQLKQTGPSPLPVSDEDIVSGALRYGGDIGAGGTCPPRYDCRAFRGCDPVPLRLQRRAEEALARKYQHTFGRPPQRPIKARP